MAYNLSNEALSPPPESVLAPSPKLLPFYFLRKLKELGILNITEDRDVSEILGK